MKVINVTVRDKIAKNDRQYDAEYICGNSDFVIVFDFDEEWNAFDNKTARFKYNGQHRDIVFTGNQVNVPIIENTHCVEVGVFAGNLHTTTPAIFTAKKSILCGSGVPAAPADDVYNQIMELLSNNDVDLEGYATEQWVKEGYQPKGNYLTQVPDGYAKTADIPTKVSQLENDKGYLTEHQDISGKLDASALPEAVNTALAQAKASGEFDGADGQPGKDGYTPQKNVDYFDGKDGKDGSPGVDGSDGITPHIGSNGNWFIGNTDTGKPSRGADGQPGQSGSPGSNGSDGVSATHSWNGTVLTITSASGTSSADLKGTKGDKGDKGDSIKGDKGDKGDTGATGQRGTGLLAVTTAPSSYTTAVGGITPKYRMAISTIKTQAGVTEVLLGDTIRYSYYLYPIAYLDASYAYCTTRVSLRGATGAAGKDYSFDPTVYGLPILELTGDTTGMTKETEVTLSYECNDKDGTAKAGSCTMKWQGSSSLAWDKKNYTIKFDNAFEVVDGWGSQKKYCLKANWIDHSHSRNVVSAKLWGLIRKNRSNLPAKLKALPNAGAIDGFPVVVMLNGEFHGLYSFNIPKDAWMFGMGSGAKEAIVTADNQAEDTAFKAETLLDADGLELEYNSSGFSATAVKDSFNALINACINSYGGDLDTEVAKYLDWESAIDYYIFTVIIKGGDMIQKNAMYATFDGVKWYFSAYDMDTTYGLAFDGSALDRAVSNVTFDEAAGDHRVFELIKRFKTNELKARYNELRANALSETRICQYFENYAWDISSPLLVEEVKRWPSVRGSSVNGIDQICRWVRQRLEATDAWANALPAQETPVEPEKPVEMVNLVPTSTDTDGSIYNGTGYKDNARLSSSGGVSGTAQTGSVVTGFIPVGAKDIIRIKGATWVQHSTPAEGHYYINFYKADKTFIEGLAASTYATNKTPMSIVYDDATGVTTFDITDNGAFETNIKDAAYFRINAYGKGADLIVTVNQEIT